MRFNRHKKVYIRARDSPYITVSQLLSYLLAVLDVLGRCVKHTFWNGQHAAIFNFDRFSSVQSAGKIKNVAGINQAIKFVYIPNLGNSH